MLGKIGVFEKPNMKNLTWKKMGLGGGSKKKSQKRKVVRNRIADNFFFQNFFADTSILESWRTFLGHFLVANP